MSETQSDLVGQSDYFSQFQKEVGGWVSHHLEVHANEPEVYKWSQVDANVVGILPERVKLGYITRDQALELTEKYNIDYHRSVDYQVLEKNWTSFEYDKLSLRTRAEYLFSRSQSWQQVKDQLSSEINDYLAEGAYLKENAQAYFDFLGQMIEAKQQRSE